jgi:hypothetical protein
MGAAGVHHYTCTPKCRYKFRLHHANDQKPWWPTWTTTSRIQGTTITTRTTSKQLYQCRQGRWWTMDGDDGRWCLTTSWHYTIITKVGCLVWVTNVHFPPFTEASLSFLLFSLTYRYSSNTSRALHTYPRHYMVSNRFVYTLLDFLQHAPSSTNRSFPLSTESCAQTHYPFSH